MRSVAKLRSLKGLSLKGLSLKGLSLKGLSLKALSVYAFCGVVLGVWPATRLGAGEPAASTTATLLGHLVDDRGSVLTEGVVSVRRHGGLYVMAMRTEHVIEEDAQGALQLELEPGVYGIHARAPGYAPTDLLVELVAGEQRELEIVLLARPSTPVEIRVETAGGEPVAGVSVRLNPVRGDELHGPALTDAEGRVAWPRVTLGAYRIDLDDPERRVAPRTSIEVLAAGPGTVHREVIRFQPLPPRLMVRGRVVDLTGVAVDRAKLELSPLHPQGPTRWREVVTGPDGRFAVELTRGADYQLLLEHDHYAGQRLDAVRMEAVDGDATELVLPAFVLRPGATVVGRIPGCPKSSALSASAMLKRGSLWADAYYLEDQSFRLSGLAQGLWTVTAECDGLKTSVEVRVDAKAEQAGTVVADLELSLPEAFQVSGRLWLGGEPYEDARVFLWLNGQPHPARVADTDASGVFLVEGVLAGSHDLRVSGPVGRLLKQRVEVDSNLDLGDVVLGAALISGRVADAESGLGLGAVDVHLSAVDHNPPDKNGIRTITSHEFPKGFSTDVAGRFKVGPLEEGRWRLKFIQAGFVPVGLEIEIRDGVEVEGIELLAQPTDGLHLVVRDHVGETPEKIVAELRKRGDSDAGDGDSQEEVARTSYYLGGKAEFHWATAPPGEYLLTVSGEDLRAILPIRIPGPTVEVILQEP